MRYITLEFKSRKKILALQSIMKDIRRAASNNHPEISKFNLKKQLIPAKIEKIEIEITKTFGSDATITIPKGSLTFLSVNAPHDRIDPKTEIRDYYIILPWNIDTNQGKKELKDLTSEISLNTNKLKYTIFENTNDSANTATATTTNAATIPNQNNIATTTIVRTNARANTDRINTARTNAPNSLLAIAHTTNNNNTTDLMTQGDMSFGELTLSDNSFEDGFEALFSKIRELEDRAYTLQTNLRDANAEITRQQNLITRKDNKIMQYIGQVVTLQNSNDAQLAQITNLNTQVGNLNRQVSNLQNTNNSYYSQLTTLRNSSDKEYTMTLTGTKNCPGIGQNWVDFGSAGRLTFAKPLNLTMN